MQGHSPSVIAHRKKVAITSGEEQRDVVYSMKTACRVSATNVCTGCTMMPKETSGDPALPDCVSDTTLITDDFNRRFEIPRKQANLIISVVGGVWETRSAEVHLRHHSIEDGGSVDISGMFTINRLSVTRPESVGAIAQRLVRLRNVNPAQVSGATVDVLT